MSLAACSNDADASGRDGSGTSSGASGAGATQSAPFGPGCAAVPRAVDNPGSLRGMAGSEVGTATSHNPILSTLSGAITSVSGLTEVLDDPTQSYTVFAPYNPGFALLSDAELGDLLSGAAAEGLDSPLATMLQHHVLTEQHDPQTVAGEHQTLAGDTLTISGDEDSMTVSDGKVTATVLCGNIVTANARVYIINQVLTGFSEG